jgi:hypothetical protein
MARPRLSANLVECFRSAPVLTIEDLFRRLSVSRATAFRRLTEIGYFSSYNHRGRYLTIEEVARFDPQGLWSFGEARFSRHGTLKETVGHFVAASPSGMTQADLSERLGVRVHNPLLDLVDEGAISREHLGPVFVYFSAAPEVRKAQLESRSSSLGEIAPRPTSRQIIAVLLELIRDPRVPREEIVSRCQRSGVRITAAAVAAIFSDFDLDKKQQ